MTTITPLQYMRPVLLTGDCDPEVPPGYGILRQTQRKVNTYYPVRRIPGRYVGGYQFLRDQQKGKTAYASTYERALFWLQEYTHHA